jgi:hypothetical protein
MNGSCLSHIRNAKHTRRQTEDKEETTGLFAHREAFQEVNAETGKCRGTPGTDYSHPVPYHFYD